MAVYKAPGGGYFNAGGSVQPPPGRGPFATPGGGGGGYGRGAASGSPLRPFPPVMPPVGGVASASPYGGYGANPAPAPTVRGNPYAGYGGGGAIPGDTRTPISASAPVGSGPRMMGANASFGNDQQGYQAGPTGVKAWGYGTTIFGGHAASSSAPAQGPGAALGAFNAAGGGFGGYAGYGGGVSTPGGGRGGVPGTPGYGRPTDLGTLLQQYQDKANADNQGRYDEGRGIIANSQAAQLGSLQSGKDAQNAIAGSISNTNLTREQRRTGQEVASQTARLYGMGLANNTGAVMARQGILDRGAEREAAASDEGKRLSLGIEGNYQNQLQNQLTGNRAQELSWIYNKDVHGPDLGLYANLLSRAGAGGQSPYGGYVGGGLRGGAGGGGGGGGNRGGFGSLTGGGPDPGSGGGANSTGYGTGQRYRGYGGGGGFQTPDPTNLAGQLGGSGAWDPSQNQGTSYSGGDPFDLYGNYGGTTGGGSTDYGGIATGGLSNQTLTPGASPGTYWDGDVLIDSSGKRWRQDQTGNIVPA